MNKPSVLLPVHNAQRTLAADVAEILDALWELAGNFELLILDDGSTDDTPEVSRELAACYPQISVLRHPLRLGLAEAIQTGLDHLQDEILLVSDEDYCCDADDMRTLWKLREAQWQAGRDGEAKRWMQDLLAWRSRTAGARRGMQHVCRASFDRLRGPQPELIGRVDAPQTTATALARRQREPKYLAITGELPQRG